MLMQDEDRRLSRWLAGRVDAKIVYMKEQAKMNEEVIVVMRDVYGVTKFYPECEKARVFASIAGTRTLTESTLRNIIKLGYRVTVQTPSVNLEAKVYE